MSNLFTWDDHINVTRGIHQLRFGVWVQRIQNNGNMAQNQFGQASFGSLKDFLQGNIRSESCNGLEHEPGKRHLVFPWRGPRAISTRICLISREAIP
ncbi:MAG TPA: hypothetical protein VKU01_24735 [Bryobacteraceae bacterium]|nr:hypothetical protein [Bryobacteraceae bacterium]